MSKQAIISFTWDTFPGPSRYYVHGRFPQPSRATTAQSEATRLDIARADDLARLGVTLLHDGEKITVPARNVLVCVM